MPVNLEITIGKNVYTQIYPGEPTDKVSVQFRVSNHADYFETEEGNPGSLNYLKDGKYWSKENASQQSSLTVIDGKRGIVEDSPFPEDKFPKRTRAVPVKDRTDPDGKVYPSLTAMCKAWNIPRYIYKGRLNLNWSKEDALCTPIAPHSKKKDK